MQKKLVTFLKRMSLKQRLILFIALITFFSIFLSNIMVMTYSKNRILSLSDVMIGNTIEQVSKNVDEVLFSKVYTLSDMLMQDDMVYEMLAHGKYPEAEHLIRLQESEKDKETNIALFSQKITNRYLIPFNGIQIAALVAKTGENIYISYSNEQSEEAVSQISNLVEKSKQSNLVASFSPLQKNIFINTEAEADRDNFVILASRSLVRPDTGEYFGAVIFAIPERIVNYTYSSIELGKTGEIFIFSKNGKIISYRDKTKLKGMKIGKEYLKLLENNVSGVNYLYENGRKTMIVLKPLKGTDWFVAGKVPVSEISENANVLLSITLMMITFAIIISLIFISVLVESIVKPVRRIISAMKKAESGNLDVSVEVSGQYEISEIAKYFNSMISRIRTLIMEEYEIEKKKKEAEMNVLMGQINPHFLYNTLESIVWKAHMAGESEISEMASSLGKLYRISVNKGTMHVKVSEELEHVKAYTDIQKLRYKNKFEYEVSVDDRTVLECYTLKMLLQPIVENAIVYGVELSNRSIRIQVNLCSHMDNLVFSVSDNGEGMTSEEVDKLIGKVKGENHSNKLQTSIAGKKHGGIGLKNINERIKLYFGENYGLSIESEKGIGTKVTVTVPIIDNEKFKF